LHTKEHGEGQMLGADDFLPIFIYSVVRAEMERPCALCKLQVEKNQGTWYISETYTCIFARLFSTMIRRLAPNAL
jgi:hypothetical protein